MAIVKGLDSDILQEEGPDLMAISKPLCWDNVFFSRAVSVQNHYPYRDYIHSSIRQFLDLYMSAAKAASQL